MSDWLTLGEESVNAENISFWDAVSVWIQKPQVINRRLRGTEILWEITMSIIDTGTNADDVIKFLYSLDYSALLLNHYNKSVEGLAETLKAKLVSCLDGSFSVSLSDENSNSSYQKLCWTLCVLYPKSIKTFGTSVELVIGDRYNSQVFFCPLLSIKPDGSITMSTNPLYKISLSENWKRHCLQLYTTANNHSLIPAPEPAQDSFSLAWVKDVLLVKLARWSEQPKLNVDPTTLREVSVSRYGEFYEELKAKYASKLIKEWTESTDPKKFVFEDLGIAAYLLTLWEDERRQKQLKEKQSFVDIGCGNGLLVYILAAEGHHGLGIDIRRRNIWDSFEQVATLKEYPITPSDDSLFPEYDWLIGNHSDELTPWIPVIAARSSYSCRFFVLPCCPWDFTAKFSSRKNGSIYRNYLDYVRHIADNCGFNVNEDNLRIPSTKRTCLIGKSRHYNIQDSNAIDLRIQEMIGSSSTVVATNTSTDEPKPKSQRSSANLKVDDHSKQSSIAEHSGPRDPAHQSNSAQQPQHWARNFSVRKEDVIRNAVAVDRDILEHITVTVLQTLLEDQTSKIKLVDGRLWNKGGSIGMDQVSGMLDSDTLQALKNERGGLQTVLRNCPDVFMVSQGKITLRDWTSDDYHQYRRSREQKQRSKKNSAKLLKTKICFFDKHHPDGCPLSSESCRFAHGVGDMRPATVK